MSAQSVPNTILLAEDDQNDAWLISRALTATSPSLQVKVVSNGQEVLDYLKGSGSYSDRTTYPFPMMVLLDIQLSGLDGLDVLRWIREQPRFRGLIVIILTGSESPEHLRTAYDLHVNSFLKKSPLLGMPDVSSNVLRYWLDFNQGPPASWD